MDKHERIVDQNLEVCKLWHEKILKILIGDKSGDHVVQKRDHEIWGHLFFWARTRPCMVREVQKVQMNKGNLTPYPFVLITD